MDGQKQATSDVGKTDLPFARAYDFILADPNLIPAEKVVLFVVLRFYPKPSTMRRASIARACGLRPDYVRNLIRWLCAGPEELRRMGRPPRRAYLRQGQITAGDTGEKLIRWLAPVGFPGDESATVIAQPKPLERDYKDAKRDLRDASAIIVPPM